MTETKTLSAAELASIVAEALKGKSVRATALKQGDSYISATWTQPNTFREVTFIGFGRSKDTLSVGIPQLKTLTALDKFYFVSGGEELVADGRTAGNVFVGEGSGHRMTFFERMVATTAVIEAPTETIESDPHVEAVIEDMIGEGLLPAESTEVGEAVLADIREEIEAEHAEVVADTHTETFGEKMKRLKAEKAARLAAEAAAIEAQIEAAV
jgi:hypothetical protein